MVNFVEKLVFLDTIDHLGCSESEVLFEADTNGAEVRRESVFHKFSIQSFFQFCNHISILLYPNSFGESKSSTKNISSVLHKVYAHT